MHRAALTDALCQAMGWDLHFFERVRLAGRTLTAALVMSLDGASTPMVWPRVPGTGLRDGSHRSPPSHRRENPLILHATFSSVNPCPADQLVAATTNVINSTTSGRMKRIRIGTISETFDHVLESEPDRTALVTPSGSLSYRELDAAANAAAAALVEFGVRPGDRVAASLPNDADIVAAFHGAMRLGAIWVGINRNLVPAEKEDLLSAAEPVLFIAEAETAASARGALADNRGECRRLRCRLEVGGMPLARPNALRRPIRTFQPVSPLPAGPPEPRKVSCTRNEISCFQRRPW